jgi:glyoxylase-like metal-dependent hydrolase (beta-lactamase superfamily II)
MKFGDFELSIIRECQFRLDGGAMFGVVPKTLWQKESPSDELNRIVLKCNLLLIESAQGHVLVECGMGSRWEKVEQERYGLETLVDSQEPLAIAGVKSSQVDFVIISHLHFDHAGGATRLMGNELVPTYPNAKYIVQSGEWQFAHKANARAKASYRLDDFDPLETHGVLQLVQGDFEVIPGVSVRLTGGHTSHHQVVTIESQGNKAIYFADILPTRSHMPPAWVMGYDHYPLASCDVKAQWLARAVKEHWLAIFDHEPGVPWGHVDCSDGRRFTFTALPAETLEYANHQNSCALKA